LHSLLLLFIFFPEFLKFLQSFLLLCKLFLTSLLGKVGAFLSALMLVPVFALDVVVALLTLVGFVTALFSVVHPDFDLECLLTPLACFWLHLARFFVISKLSCSR